MVYVDMKNINFKILFHVPFFVLQNHAYRNYKKQMKFEKNKLFSWVNKNNNPF